MRILSRLTAAAAMVGLAVFAVTPDSAARAQAQAQGPVQLGGPLPGQTPGPGQGPQSAHHHHHHLHHHHQHSPSSASSASGGGPPQPPLPPPPATTTSTKTKAIRPQEALETGPPGMGMDLRGPPMGMQMGGMGGSPMGMPPPFGFGIERGPPQPPPGYAPHKMGGVGGPQGGKMGGNGMFGGMQGMP